MSTDKPTPESDLASFGMPTSYIATSDSTLRVVLVEKAERLERQRDEYARQLAEVTRERDEAKRCPYATGMRDADLARIEELAKENAQLRADLAALREKIVSEIDRMDAAVCEDEARERGSYWVDSYKQFEAFLCGLIPAAEHTPAEETKP